MRGNNKYLLLFLFLLIGICFICPTKIFASDNIPEGLQYTIVDNYVVIVGYTEYATNINIPKTIDGLPVTTIADRAFFACESLRSVIIPDSVTTIGEAAFKNCRNLLSITIPDGVTIIEKDTFFDCCKLNEINMPNGIRSIGNCAFYGTNLASVTIPDSVTVIGDSAFYDCDNLYNITIPDNVVDIGNNAFNNCDNLTNVTIGNNVTNIGYYVFQDCAYLTSVHIGNNVTSIGYAAFKNCSSLCDINIPNTVTSINSFAFYGCSALPKIELGSGVTSIGNDSFRYCNQLTDIIIPNNTTYIGSWAFYGCTGLKNVLYKGTPEQWNLIEIYSGNEYLLRANITYEDHYECSYNEWVITKSPTFTEPGEQCSICSKCGYIIIETIDKLVAKVSQLNITLEDDYAVNFYLQISESIESTAKVRLTIGNDTVTHNISNLAKTNDGYFRLTANISAAQMNEIITVMVMNGREIGCNSTYTAREYCDTILAKSEHSAYHALVREMLNYGAMAQMYFNYDTEYLANDGITGVANAEIPDTADEMIISNKISGLNFYGASLVYRDRIAVRYYFTGDVTDCTFTANGNTYTPVAKDGMYYVEIPDILPQDLDQQITLVVADTAGDTLSVSYGPMNYIVRMNVKGNENLQNLLKALYNYHLAAKELSQSAA